MSDSAFDDIARMLATGQSRRGFLRALTLAAVGLSIEGVGSIGATSVAFAAAPTCSVKDVARCQDRVDSEYNRNLVLECGPAAVPCALDPTKLVCLGSGGAILACIAKVKANHEAALAACEEVGCTDGAICS